MKKVLIAFDPQEISTAQLAAIRALVPEDDLLITSDAAQIEAIQHEVEIATGRLSPAAFIPNAPNLHWFQQTGAGADWLVRKPGIARPGLQITNASGVHAIPISEHILAYMLAFARALPVEFHTRIDKDSRTDWDDDKPGQQVFELAGKTMLLLGVGAIGERTAQSASALGMHVLGIRRDPTRQSAGVEVMYGPDHLGDLLPQADFVVLTIPLSPETDGMIGEAELRKMKPTAILINIGRGGTVDQAALVRALQEGRIAGAGLDVFDPEPLPPDSPLWDMPNVIVTRHYSGSTPHYTERVLAIFIDNLARYKKGEPLRNLLDLELGIRIS